VSKQVFVVAGEASGDAHAGRVIKALKQQDTTIQITAVGGEQLRDAGAEILVDFSELAVMGLVEVLKRYRHIKGIFKQVCAYLEANKPDLLILVDYPGFNLKLAKAAKALGIPVMYYISPKIWAWRAGRIHTIKRYVDHMAVLFPFEQALYENAGVPVTCVGHPLVDAVYCELSHQQAKQHFTIAAEQRVIGLFPGSRRSEVSALLPVMVAAAERIYARHPDISVVLPIAPGLPESYLQQILKQTKTELPIKLVEGDFYPLVKACDAIVAASGTVTLEIALLGTPHFICYRVSPISYAILSRLVKIPYVGLCNIVTQQALIQEVLQKEVSPERLDVELTRLFSEPTARSHAEEIQQTVLKALGPAGGADNAAQLVLKLLNDDD
jgi:lipid-A-disaccharide synthase